MKKKFGIMGIALVLVLMASLCFGSVALAADFEPVEVDIDWDGGGLLDGTVIAGDDAITTFSTGGSHIEGTFTADYTAGSYDYMQVNTLVSRIDATVSGGGYIEYQTDRTDCYGGWSPAGQVSYSFVGTNDGNASMGTGSTSHLNGLIDYQYPLQGTLAVDSSSNYEIIRSLSVDNILVEAWAYGSGSAILENQLSAIDYQFAPSGAELGYYCTQSWSRRSFSAVGSGTFELYGTGDNGTTFNNINMTGSTGGLVAWNGSLDLSGLPTVTATDVGSGASLNIIANFTSSFNMGDYSMRAW